MKLGKLDWLVVVAFVAVTSIAVVALAQGLAQGAGRSMDQEQQWCRERGLKYTTMTEWDGEIRVTKVVCVDKRRKPIAPGSAGR